MEAAIEAARAAADVVRADFDSVHEVRLKGDVDPVTATDLRAENAIRETLAHLFPADEILGEEAGGVGWENGRVWVVDPLDGTISFMHGMPHVAVSVALWVDGEPTVGVVVDVLRDEVFTARAGHGACLNNEPMQVSPVPDLIDSVVATGFPYDRRRHADAYASVLGKVLAEVQGVRRMGSAALDLAWVACGRYDAYWEYGLAPWDAAAGALLVTEAGGRLSDHAGADHRLDSPTLVASNGQVHERLRAIVGTHLPSHLR
jgi:myo-inositol-1(or 4)-monophosphatase